MNQVVVGIIRRTPLAGQKEKFLLIQSKKDFGQYTGCWYPPGGHIEAGEDEAAALSREIKEELGLMILPVKRIAESTGDVPDQTTYWWLCQQPDNEITLDEGEISQAGWFTFEEMTQLPLWPATRKFFEKYLSEISV